MATYEEQFYITRRNPVARLWRDVRLVVYLIKMMWRWHAEGGRLRRSYRSRASAGQVYYIDRPEGRP